MAIWRITVNGELYGVEKWANVYHVDGSPGAPPTGVLDAFENAYNVAAAGGGMSFLNPCAGTVATGLVGVHMSSITAQAVVTPAPPILRSVDHKGGQNTAGGLPVDVALCITWKTPLAGRSYRGRTYLPPWHSNQLLDTAGMPEPVPASRAAVVVNAKKLVTDLDGLAWPLVVYSRSLGSAQLVTAGHIDSNWDTQRRRSNKQPTVRSQFTTP